MSINFHLKKLALLVFTIGISGFNIQALAQSNLPALAGICYDTYVDANSETSLVETYYDQFKSAVSTAGAHATILSGSLNRVTGNGSIQISPEIFNELGKALEMDQARVMNRITQLDELRKVYRRGANRPINSAFTKAQVLSDLRYNTRASIELNELAHRHQVLSLSSDATSTLANTAAGVQKVIKFADAAGKILDWSQVAIEAIEAAGLAVQGEANFQDVEDIAVAGSKVLIPILGAYDAYSNIAGSNEIIDNHFNNITDTINDVTAEFNGYAAQIVEAGYNYQEFDRTDIETLTELRDTRVAELEDLWSSHVTLSVIGSLNIVLSGKDEEYGEIAKRFNQLIYDLKTMSIIDFLREHHALGLDYRYAQEVFKEKDALEALRSVTQSFERLNTAIFCDQALERAKFLANAALTALEHIQQSASQANEVQPGEQSSSSDTVFTSSATPSGVIQGNVRLENGTLDLQGRELRITGNLIQSGGTLLINKGRLIVEGNYRIQTPDGSGGYGNSSGSLRMGAPEDYVLVQGDFITQSNLHHCSGGNSNWFLTDGILEVKGNLTQVNGQIANLCTRVNHKTLLSGETSQVVTLTEGLFATLELTNSSTQGVQFASDMRIANFIPNDTTIPETSIVSSWLLAADTEINGNFVLKSSTLNLQGHTLTVKGDFIQPGGTLLVNKGRLIVEGNYRIQTPDGSGGYGNSSGSLRMGAPEDYVLVQGDFITQSNLHHCSGGNSNWFLTDGILEVKGNLIQVNGQIANLCTRVNHKTLLSGSARQRIRLDSTGPLSKLEITNHTTAQNEGVWFDSKVIISTLFNHRGKVFQLSPSAEETDFPDFDGDGQRDHLDPYPLTAMHVDSDQDGVTDDLDLFPNDPVDWRDSDQDGIGDNRDDDDNNDGIPDFLEGRPTITSVSPERAVLNEATVFTVTGINLPDNMKFEIQGCVSPNVELPGGTVTERRFICTPKTSGNLAGLVKPTTNGIIFYDFEVLVSEDTAFASPIVTSVSPFINTLDEVSVFTIRGINLPDGMGFTVGDCEHSNTELPGGSDTERQFTCTQRGGAGIKRGLIKTAPGGDVLFEFAVNSLDPTAIVDTDDDGVPDDDDSDDDNDGMPDSWEEQHSLDPKSATDALLDLDEDTLTSLREFQFGTNPTIFDPPEQWQCTNYDPVGMPQVYLRCVQVLDNIFSLGMDPIAAENGVPRFQVDLETIQPLSTIPTQSCAAFPSGPSGHLRLNCLDLGLDVPYWVELNLVNNPSAILFDVINAGPMQ